MEDAKYEYYFVTGQSIDTEIGELRPVMLEEYMEAMQHLQVLMLSEYEFIPTLVQQVPEQYASIHREILSAYKTIYDILRVGGGALNTPILQAYRQLYQEAFEFFYGEGSYGRIKSAEEFSFFRRLAIESTGVPYREPNPNPEIERFERLQEARDREKGSKITFKGIYSSLMVQMGVGSDFLNKLSIYQFYMLFQRMQFLKSYEAVAPVEVAFGSKSPTQWYDIPKKTGAIEISRDELSRYEI